MTATRRPFADGVASGDPTSDGVILWTRVAPATIGHRARTVEVRWEIARPGHAVERSGIAVADGVADHCVHVDVSDLRPATTYRYAFEVGGERIEGTTRTLPASADRVRIAVMCCSRWGWPGFQLFEHIAASNPDFVLHLGDSIYEIGEIAPSCESTDPPHDCHTLSDYRRRYRQYRTDPRWRALLASVPMIALWDDHEVVDDAPDPHAADRRRAGQRAWAEWMPSRIALGARSPDGPLDRTVSIEGLLDLVIVDSRFGGRVPSDVEGPAAEDAAPGPMLHDGQWQRLETFAAGSTAPWFVLANQVQVSPMTLAARPAIGWPPWRRIVNPDQWDGFPADRSRLAQVLLGVAGRPVVLSGDLHSAWSRRFIEDGRSVAHEFTSPSISGLTYADAVRERLPLPTGLLERWLRLINPGIDHLDLRRHGFLLCDITADELRTAFVTADGARHAVALPRTETNDHGNGVAKGVLGG